MSGITARIMNSVIFPVPKTQGHYSEKPVFFECGLYMLDVDFPNGAIRINRFDCNNHQVRIHTEKCGI